MIKNIIIFFFICFFSIGESKTAKAQHIIDFTLPTPWTEEALKVDIPLSEYPRPQLVRSEWLNLNGIWDYMVDSTVIHPNSTIYPPSFPDNTEKIKVPFPPESELSGIARSGDSCLWYRKVFSIPKAWKGKHILLNFGAVDRISIIFVNGRKVGIHIGGYNAFSFDITDYLNQKENTLIVGAYDPNDGRAPSGKNGPRGDYTFTSGIWQTVWIEPVEKQHISNIQLNPNLKDNCLKITTSCTEKNLTIIATAYDQKKEIARTLSKSNITFNLPISNPHKWSPDDPFLYSLKLQLKNQKGEIVDEIDSYFGMRSIKLKNIDGVIRPTLNDEFIFHLGLLDQGYWPDGIFTAPTDEALQYDIQLAKRSGFNVIRKHIKVEPQRWYYHCDRLGLMVWQDMPNLWEPDGTDSIIIRQQFKNELKEMIDQHINSPSIVMWVPFNENWGAFNVKEITDWIKKYDPNRLVNGMSGYNYSPNYRKAYGDPGNGDFIDVHHYGDITPQIIPNSNENRAISLGEFGGKGLFMRGHMWPVYNDAYEMMLDKEHLTDTYILMLTRLEQMIKYFGLSAAIYTQTTDVEHEINGLVTYDRKIEKMNINKVQAINKAIIESTRK